MDDLKQRYEAAVTPWSDIQDHLPYFVDLATTMNATSVLELGVRAGTSTAAWLYAMDQTDGRVVSVDISKDVDFDTPRWEFILGNDLDAPTAKAVEAFAPFDIIFVDTCHEYEHTKSEIRTYWPMLRNGGAILFHDTDVPVFDHHTTSEPDYPVRTAVNDWVTAIQNHSATITPTVRVRHSSFGLTTVITTWPK